MINAIAVLEAAGRVSPRWGFASLSNAGHRERPPPPAPLPPASICSTAFSRTPASPDPSAVPALPSSPRGRNRRRPLGSLLRSLASAARPWARTGPWARTATSGSGRCPRRAMRHDRTSAAAAASSPALGCAAVVGHPSPLVRRRQRQQLRPRAAPAHARATTARRRRRPDQASPHPQRLLHLPEPAGQGMRRPPPGAPRRADGC
jgi:hypothetical protein